MHAYMFDKYGNLTESLGHMSEKDYDDVVYYAENMFGFDLNEDGIMGQPSGDTSSYYKLNELEGFADLGFTTFDDTENFINLYLDRGNGDIYFGEKNSGISTKIIHYDGNSYGPQSQADIPLAIEYVGEDSPFGYYAGKYLFIVKSCLAHKA